MRKLSSVLFAALVLASCGGSAAAPTATAPTSASPPASGFAPASGKPLTHIRFALGNPIINPGLSYTWVGSYFGWYQQQGLDIEIVGTQGTADATQRAAAGQVEFALPPPSSYVTPAANGQDLGVTSVYLLRRHGQYSFGVTQDSSLKDLPALKGKKVGVPSLGDEAVTYVKAAERELKMAENDIQIVPVGAAGEATASLNKGGVDALALPGVQYALVEGLGVKLRYLPQPAFASKIFGNEIITKRDYVKQHPEVVKGLVRGYAMGEEFFLANPKAAIQISFKMFPATIPKGMTLEEAIDNQVAALPANIETLRFDDKACKKWGCNEEADWKAYVDYLGLDPGKVGDVTRFYTNEFIDYANDFDAKAIREMAQKFVLK